MKTLEKWNPFRVSPSWDPFREIEEMQNRLASLIGRRLPTPDGRGEAFGLTEWMPPVDIAEDDKEYIIKAELPGVSKEDVKVTVEGGVLSISGERKAEKDKKTRSIIGSSGATGVSFGASLSLRAHPPIKSVPSSRTGYSNCTSRRTKRRNRKRST